MVLRQSGTVWTTGGNTRGQLGDGSSKSKVAFAKVMTDAKSVAAGYYHTVVLKQDKTVLTTGWNNVGQLGASVDGYSKMFIQVMTDAQFVGAGAYHTLVIRQEKLYGCGDIGAKFVSGAGSTSTELVLMESNVHFAAGGLGFTLVVKDGGSVWATGKNGYGQLGTQNKEDQDSFVKVVEGDAISVAAGAEHSLVLLKDGRVLASGRSKFIGVGMHAQDKMVFTQVASAAAAIIAGPSHSMIITRGGGVDVTGSNSYGQLGLGDTVVHKYEYARVVSDGVRVAAAGNSHALIQKKDGSVWLTG